MKRRFFKGHRRRCSNSNTLPAGIIKAVDKFFEDVQESLDAVEQRERKLDRWERSLVEPVER